MRKMGGQHKGVNGESLHSDRKILDTSFGFLGVGVNTKRASKSNCGSGSLSTMFEDNSSLSSTNFPDTIWPTSFAGIGENPGPTTKGWCRIDAEMESKTLHIERPAWDATGKAVIAQDDRSDRFGGRKLANKWRHNKGRPTLWRRYLGQGRMNGP